MLQFITMSNRNMNWKMQIKFNFMMDKNLFVGVFIIFFLSLTLNTKDGL